MRPDEWLIEQGRLDTEQRQVIHRNLADSYVVEGSAGSGKTVMAVYKSVIFGGLPSTSCVVLVYTKALKLMLKYGLEYSRTRLGVRNLNSKAVYGWAWSNRGMDLDGEVFRKKGDGNILYLRNGNEVLTFKKCEQAVKDRYENLYKTYLANVTQMPIDRRKAAEAEFSKLVSIDFGDHVTNELYSTYGRRTKFFEAIHTPQGIDLDNSAIYEAVPAAVLFTKKPKIDHMIVDEAQDFSQSNVQSFISDKTKSIVFFGDTAQQLYVNQGSNLETLSTTTKLPRIELKKNYRLPKDIARVAEYINLSEKGKLLARCQKGYNDEKNPSFYLKKCNSKDEELQYILNNCNPLVSGDIGILVPTNKQVEEVRKYFEERNKGCQYRYNKPLSGFAQTTSYNDFMNTEYGSVLYNQVDTLNFQSNLPCILTYHSAKGTQFDTVFLPFANDELYHNGMKRNELYVAITRSSNKVYITYQGNKTSLLKDVPSEFYQTI